ncbi:unnamed protein product [Adineta steineri]|uniref:NACHT domain-containing protein n=1 Tax=Adineta steineri TaxID=433720 RepID=A0A814VU61_9BILA|nr:unnamed protein product [Adineta steineri]CAF4052883.1 unnamed protein product [Adineta steineri]
MFKICKDQTKRLLVFGRAGIGKTTFCQYVAHKWSIGAIWQQYQLVVFIRLRNLTEWRYPLLTSGARYSLIDIVKTEYLHHDLTDKYETLLKEELNNNQILWLLDGYDEIAQNIPLHLKYLLEQLLKTPHHILTSRPYLNTLSYDVQMEITGFTDDNITKYVKQFFDQTNDEMGNASIQTENLLNFLRCNVRIWGIAHIPVTLELICSLWCDTDWSETTTLTITVVYDKMIEWICRRHLKKHNIPSNQMTKEDVYQHLHKELAFLECLAFNAMERKTIIISPIILRIALKQSECSLQHQSHLLNIGVLKSLDYKPIGTILEADKNHYFVHLSFQEYFTARYLVKALDGACDQKKKAIDFIKTHKYNQRYEFIFTFVSGLVNDYSNIHCRDFFWTTLLEEPLDLIGIRHAQVIICCLEDADCDTSIPQYRQLINLIIKWINYIIYMTDDALIHPLADSLRRSPSLVNQPEIVDAFIKLYTHKNSKIRSSVSKFISVLPITHSYEALIQLHITALVKKAGYIRCSVLWPLARLAAKAATNEIIHRLINLLDDTNNEVRKRACYTLGRMGDKAATNEVIHRLIHLLDDPDNKVTLSALEALLKLDAKEATNEAIHRLISLLNDTNNNVRESAFGILVRLDEKAAKYEAIHQLISLLNDTDSKIRKSAFGVLLRLGEKAATNETTHRLLRLLDDNHSEVRKHTCYILGAIGDKAATNAMIYKFINLLDDTNYEVRKSACHALARMGNKAATNEAAHRLIRLLDDTDNEVRKHACSTLGAMGDKVATNEMIHKFINLLDDTNYEVRKSACHALGRIDNKATINEVIHKLISLLDDTDNELRKHVCSTLGSMGDKAATNEVMHKLISLLDDTDNKIKESACYALVKMGDKAAIDEVIHKFISLLDDTDYGVKKSACYALGEMHDKAAKNEVIYRLIILLDDTDCGVRKSACYALVNMGDEAATNEVIHRLIRLLGDTDNEVRDSAGYALVRMGDKVPINDVIHQLISLIGDAKYDVRKSACSTLGRMGDKAATNEVIHRVISLLDDTNSKVKESACHVLLTMGGKAVTDEVVSKIFVMFNYGEIGIWAIESMLTNIFGSLSCMSSMKHDAVQILSNCVEREDVMFRLKNVSEKFIQAYVITGISYWLPIIKKICFTKGYALTVDKDTITVYGSEVPVQLPLSNEELGQTLRNYFVNWPEESLQSYNRVVN